MLDGCSCLISGALSSSSEQDSKWVYMRYSFIEVPNGKRGFEDEEGEVELFAERKPSKRLGKHGAEVISPTLHNLFPSTADACNKQSHDGDEVDVNCNPTEGKKLYGERKLSKQMDDLELSLSIISDEECKYVNGAPNLKDGLVWKKSSKLLHLNENDELTLTMHDLHLSPANVSNQQSHDWYRFDGKGKWPLEDLREEALLGKKKSSKRLDMHKKDELILTLHDLRISSVDQSDQCDDCDRRDMKGKRPCEDVEEELLVKRKSSKRLFMHVSHEVTCMLKDCFLSSVDQSDQHGNDGDQADTSSLIQSLGRDISINCLLRCSRSDYNSLASLNRSFRNLIRNGELYRLRRQMQVIEHWVYFSCDILEWEAFDPICRRWMHLPRMPANDCFRCSDKESLAVGTELLVFGKEITSNVIWKYSILTNSWSSGMEMNAPRCLFGSASSGEIAILAGGCDSQGKVLSSAELYNSEKGTWENLPSMKKPRKMCSGVFMDGKFYVIGGSNTELLSCGEEYNLETKTWREIPNMCPRRTGPTEAPPLVAVVNNELYAADYAERELMKYNKERVSWDTVGRLPERAVSTNGWGLAFRACGDQIIVIGGPRSLGGAMIELNSWVPGEGLPQWNLLARKQSGGFVYNCAVMGC